MISANRTCKYTLSVANKIDLYIYVQQLSYLPSMKMKYSGQAKNIQTNAEEFSRNGGNNKVS